MAADNIEVVDYNAARNCADHVGQRKLPSPSADSMHSGASGAAGSATGSVAAALASALRAIAEAASDSGGHMGNGTNGLKKSSTFIRTSVDGFEKTQDSTADTVHSAGG